jgi:Icc-related predicted phosphoesterase
MKKKYKILCVSDIDILSNMNLESMKNKFKDIDFIISAGDVSNRYIDFLVSTLDKDLIYVNGNHIYHKDYPITFAKNIDGKFLKYKGLRILGLDGSKLYSHKEHQYTDFQMACKVFKNIFSLCLGVDIVVSHASPKGIHDIDEKVHEGFKIFNKVIKWFKPKLWVHGHVHLYNYLAVQETYVGDTRIMNVFGYKLLEIEK